MERIRYEHGDEERYPHGADVLEREFSDGGFSRGWCLQAKPLPAYYFDAHVHYAGKPGVAAAEALAGDAAQAADLGVKRALVILQIYGKTPPASLSKHTAGFPSFTVEELRAALDPPAGGQPITWSAFPRYDAAEPELVMAAADAGARCIKLHNAPVITENADPELWLSPAWQDCFAAMAERGLPVLWHVTQRMSPCPYSGGGRNSYWSKGWAKGVRFTNEDLLQVFLECAKRNPGVAFIGAHQLHIGWERLEELFLGYPNLYVDTSCGCTLRSGDTLYPHDRDFLQRMLSRWADRILFGTDTFWGASPSRCGFEGMRRHIRFLEALGLPQAALDTICHGAMERLMGMGS